MIVIKCLFGIDFHPNFVHGAALNQLGVGTKSLAGIRYYADIIQIPRKREKELNFWIFFF